MPVYTYRHKVTKEEIHEVHSVDKRDTMPDGKPPEESEWERIIAGTINARRGDGWGKGKGFYNSYGD